MKLWDYAKIFGTANIPRKTTSNFRLLRNEEEIPKVRVINNKLHSETFKVLRRFVTPQYENIYLMRNKKGFNTVAFQQEYDVVIADKNGKVIKTFLSVPTGFISEYFKESYSIFFMTIGSIKSFDINKSDRLQLTRIILEDI